MRRLSPQVEGARVLGEHCVRISEPACFWPEQQAPARGHAGT